MDEPTPRVLPWAILSVWALLLGSITLTPGPPIHPDQLVSPLCVLCGSRSGADAVLNIVLFLPLGALMLRLAGPVRGMIAGVVLSTAIEVAQLWIPGRYPTLGDVVWNASGATLGVGAAWLTVSALEGGSTARMARFLSLALPVAYLFISGAFLRPQGTDAPYFGQWTPDLAYLPEYGGEVLAAGSSRGPIPDGPWAAGSGLREEPGWWIDVDMVVGPEPLAVAPVVSVYDDQLREIWLLGALGNDLVWRERTRSAAFGFDSPDLRIPGAFLGTVPGDTVTIGASADGERRCLTVGDLQVCGQGVSPGRTWGVLMYLEGTTSLQRAVLDVAWMATLFLLVGVGGGMRWGTVSSVVLAAVLLLAVVATTRLEAPPVRDWCGLLAGVALGVGLRPPLRRILGAQEDGGTLRRE